MTSGVLAIAPPPAVSFASMPLACGEVVEPCDPSDTTSSLIKGVWSIPETVCRMALNGVIVLPFVPSTRRLRGIALHEIFPNNLDPAGHRKARRGVRYLRLIGVVLSPPPLISMFSTVGQSLSALYALTASARYSCRSLCDHIDFVDVDFFTFLPVFARGAPGVRCPREATSGLGFMTTG